MGVPWDKDPQHRLTDSGQVLLDRARHADVLEYLWFLNSHREVVYSHMHGDKDTYKLAFFLAGKLGDFYQVGLCVVARLGCLGFVVCDERAHLHSTDHKPKHPLPPPQKKQKPKRCGALRATR